MLVDLESHPERSLYYVGARMIHALREAPTGRIEIEWLFRRLNDGGGVRSVPLEYCMLAADWLFLLGVVKVTPDGDIERCF